MIAHVVLFEPRSDLAPSARAQFADAFTRAITTIPQVRRARVGERRNLARLYDRQNPRDYSFVAIIEFDSEADLATYLDHPAHEELGLRFYQTAQAVQVYDFVLSEGHEVRRVFGAESGPEPVRT